MASAEVYVIAIDQFFQTGHPNVKANHKTFTNCWRGMNVKHTSVGLLSFGHFSVDFYQGVIPALIPFFIVQHDFTYAAAAGFIFAMNVTSSIIQPLFGQFADSLSAPWLMPLGIAMAGGGLALTGFSSNYWLILALTAVSGIGIAAFHPEGARAVNQVTGKRKARGMSVFSIGGNAGFAVGPIVTTACVAAVGLRGTLLLFIPAGIMAFIFMTQLFRFTRPAENTPKGGSSVQVEKPADAWGPFGILSAVLVFRSILFYGLNTFLPLYWIHVLLQSEVVGGSALTIFLMSGLVGTLTGGFAADRYGRKRVVATSFILLTPLLFLFLVVQDVTMATLMLVPVGILTFAPTSVMVVMGQSYLPNRVGMASGVTLGLAVSVGGIVAPALGWVADHSNLHVTLLVLAFFPMLSAILSLTLPRADQVLKAGSG